MSESKVRFSTRELSMRTFPDFEEFFAQVHGCACTLYFFGRHLTVMPGTAEDRAKLLGRPDRSRKYFPRQELRRAREAAAVKELVRKRDVDNRVIRIKAHELGSWYAAIQDEGDYLCLLRKSLLELSFSGESKNQLAPEKDREINLSLARSNGYLPVRDTEFLGDGANSLTLRLRNCRSNRQVSSLLVRRQLRLGLGTTGAACRRPYSPRPEPPSRAITLPVTREPDSVQAVAERAQ
jgi:hypothetical protein